MSCGLESSRHSESNTGNTAFMHGDWPLGRVHAGFNAINEIARPER
jgi:hypothetical protein